MGSQNGAKIVRNDVLGSPLHKGGSQVASRPSPRSILDRFWDNVGTIVDRFSNIVGVISRCVVQEHVANTYLQNHMDSNKTCTRHNTQNHTAVKTKSFESLCPPKNGALATGGAGGSGRSP